MNRRLLACLFLGLCLCWPLPGRADKVPLAFLAPGYVLLDGNLHVFDVPRSANGTALGPALLESVDDGYAFTAYLTSRGCSVNPDQGAPRLSHREHSADLLTRHSLAKPRVDIMECETIWVIGIRTAHGGVTCPNRVIYRKGDCGSIDHYLSETLFGSGFEG